MAVGALVEGRAGLSRIASSCWRVVMLGDAERGCGRVSCGGWFAMLEGTRTVRVGTMCAVAILVGWNGWQGPRWRCRSDCGHGFENGDSPFLRCLEAALCPPKVLTRWNGGAL